MELEAINELNQLKAVVAALNEIKVGNLPYILAMKVVDARNTLDDLLVEVADYVQEANEINDPGQWN